MKNKITKQNDCYFRNGKQISNFTIKILYTFDKNFQNIDILSRPFLIEIKNFHETTKTILFTKKISSYNFMLAFLNEGNFVFKDISKKDWIDLIRQELNSSGNFTIY